MSAKLSKTTTQPDLRVHGPFFEQIFRKNPIGMVVCTLSGEFIECNQEFADLVGYSCDEVCGMKIADITHPEDLAENKERDAELIESKRSSFSMEKRYIRKDGTVIWVSLNVSIATDEASGDRFFIACVEDITEKKTSFSKIETDMAFVNSLIEHLPIGLFCKDYSSGTGVFVSWNMMAEKLWGVTKDQILGKTDFDLFPEGEANKFKEDDLSTLDSNGIQYIEHETITSPQKGHIDLRTWKVPIRMGSKSRYLLGVSLDITQQIMMERDLRVAKSEAERANRLKTDFLAMMSHEIRTPLNGIIGSIDLMQDMASEAEKNEYMMAIKESGLHLHSLINNILDYTKLDVGMMQYNLRPVRTADLFERVEGIFIKEINKGDVAFKATIDDSVPENFMTDGVKVKQVLVNLIGNAFKFTKEGQIELRIGREGNDLVLCVRDSGEGIPEHLQKEIFEPFGQVGREHHDAPGTGLGLPICKGIIEGLGGTMTLSSKPGEGSEFVARIPYVQVEASKIVETAKSVPKREMDLRILIAEDNDLNLKITKAMVEKLGCKPEVARNGEEAIALCREKTFDIVLMDCAMPVMDGYEATRIIKREIAPPPIVLAITANAFDEDKGRCESAGMDDFLPKPFTFGTLRDIIRRYMHDEDGIAS